MQNILIYIKYKLNPNKVQIDAKLDGIKGFATNDFTLKANDAIAYYQNQYTVFMEFERRLKLKKISFKFSF